MPLTVLALLCLFVLLISDALLWLRVWRLPPGPERVGQLIGALGGFVAVLAAGFFVFLTLKGGS